MEKADCFAGVGLVCLVLVNLFHYRRLGPISYGLYAVVLILLAILLIDKKIFDIPFVHDRDGIHRWFKIGFGFLIQPSEFCKIAYILALAWYLRFRSNFREFWGLLGPFALTLLAMVLILLEPDLGTTMLLMPVLFTMLFVAGAKVKHLAIILCIGLAVSRYCGSLCDRTSECESPRCCCKTKKSLPPPKRTKNWPEILVKDPDKLRTWKGDDGFQLLHAKRAIASGGLTGYGFGKGPYLQNRSYLNLPEADNDMIFAVIGINSGFSVAGRCCCSILR